MIEYFVLVGMACFLAGFFTHLIIDIFTSGR